MRQQYAISEYPNVDEMYAKLEALLTQPLRPVRREKTTEYLNYFETKCERSSRFEAVLKECDA